MTPKQQRFVDEYMVDRNATQAAIRAGYSPKGAEVNASKMLRYPKVAEAIASATQAQSERTKINADWVLERLAAEATADVADIYAENGGLKPIRDWPLIWRQGLVSGLDVDEKPGQPGQVVKVKLSDRIRRLELIGKHIGVQAFAERHEHTGRDGGPMETVLALTDMEFARGMAFVLAKAAQKTPESGDK